MLYSVRKRITIKNLHTGRSIRGEQTFGREKVIWSVTISLPLSPLAYFINMSPPYQTYDNPLAQWLGNPVQQRNCSSNNSPSLGPWGPHSPSACAPFLQSKPPRFPQRFCSIRVDIRLHQMWVFCHSFLLFLLFFSFSSFVHFVLSLFIFVLSIFLSLLFCLIDRPFENANMLPSS